MIIAFFLDKRKGGPHVYHTNILKEFKLFSRNIFLDKKDIINFLNLKIFYKIFFIIDVLVNSLKIFQYFRHQKYTTFFVYSLYNLSPIFAGILLKKRVIWFLIEEPNLFIKFILNFIPKTKLRFVVINPEIAKKLQIKNYRLYVPNLSNFINKKIRKKNLAISIGNLNRVKNHIFLVNSLKNMKENYKLFIVGGKLKTQSNYFKILKKKVNENDKIILLGKKKKSAIKKYLISAKFFILPSLSEGLSIALIEAINSHCICIISRNSNSSKLIKNNYNGFIFDLNTKSFRSSFKKALYLNEKKRILFNTRLKKSLTILYKKNNLSQNYLIK